MLQKFTIIPKVCSFLLTEFKIYFSVPKVQQKLPSCNLQSFMKLKTNETAWQTAQYTAYDKKNQRMLMEYVKNDLQRETSCAVYTGCPRRNVKYFGRVFLMLNYTDITQNTYVQSWTVMEIMAKEKSGHLAFPRTVRLQLCSALTLTEQCSTHLCDGKSSPNAIR